MEKKDMTTEELVQYYEAKLKEKDEKLNMLQEENEHLRSALESRDEDFITLEDETVDIRKKDKDYGIMSTRHHELLPKIAPNKQQISLQIPKRAEEHRTMKIHVLGSVGKVNEGPNHKTTKLLCSTTLDCRDDLLNSGVALHITMKQDKFPELQKVQLKKVERPKSTTSLFLPPHN